MTLSELPKKVHRALVVDDNEDDCADVSGILESLGFSVRVARTVEEALAALAEEEFCLLVFDQALPLKPKDKPMVTGGERLVREARQMDSRTVNGAHVTPIVAITNYSERSAFVTGLFEIGITTFVPKPVSENLTYFVEKVRGALGRAGRDEHGKCAGLSRRVHANGDAFTVNITLHGKVTNSGRTEILIGEKVRDMQDSMFLVILRGIVAREREVDGWSSRDALGIGGNRAATTIIRQTFEGLVPAGFDPLPGDRRGNFRLHPSVVVARVDWDVLAAHPDARVQKVAVEQRKRLLRV